MRPYFVFHNLSATAQPTHSPNCAQFLAKTGAEMQSEMGSLGERERDGDGVLDKESRREQSGISVLLRFMKRFINKYMCSDAFVLHVCVCDYSPFCTIRIQNLLKNIF